MLKCQFSTHLPQLCCQVALKAAELHDASLQSATHSQPHPHSSPQFCYRLTREAGVTLIPVSAFYSDRSEAPRTLVRFVFCKTDAKLQAACDALRAYFGKPQ